MASRMSLFRAPPFRSRKSSGGLLITSVVTDLSRKICSVKRALIPNFWPFATRWTQVFLSIYLEVYIPWSRRCYDFSTHYLSR
ncbi:unnamed protein product [Soboliphyme baturini]|uniref:Uncharacterized protein n=1 Tax=Soboliphyme baturini TaxID=241478 RepID=A0A183J1V7_9BILA|nr:unnamed protein product [Soboliphyme baturini]